MTEEEMIEAIKRSGYLFEAEVVTHLVERGYFVESNLVFKDPLTNKDREIDIFAEPSPWGKFSLVKRKEKVSCHVSYCFELKSNLYPVVLMTERLNYMADSFFKEVITIPQGVTYEPFSGFEKTLLTESKYFAQYCSFAEKKEERQKNNGQNPNRLSLFMATHPEELYSSINKLCLFNEERANFWEKTFQGKAGNHEYFRHWLFVPVLLLKNDLYELTLEENTPTLEKVGMSRLIVNYYYKERPSSVMVFVVTYEHLEEWMDRMDQLSWEVGEMMESALAQRSKT